MTLNRSEVEILIAGLDALIENGDNRGQDAECIKSKLILAIDEGEIEVFGTRQEELLEAIIASNKELLKVLSETI